MTINKNEYEKGNTVLLSKKIGAGWWKDGLRNVAKLKMYIAIYCKSAFVQCCGTKVKWDILFLCVVVGVIFHGILNRMWSFCISLLKPDTQSTKHLFSLSHKHKVPARASVNTLVWCWCKFCVGGIQSQWEWEGLLHLTAFLLLIAKKNKKTHVDTIFTWFGFKQLRNCVWVGEDQIHTRDPAAFVR